MVIHYGRCQSVFNQQTYLRSRFLFITHFIKIFFKGCAVNNAVMYIDHSSHVDLESLLLFNRFLYPSGRHYLPTCFRLHRLTFRVKQIQPVHRPSPLNMAAFLLATVQKQFFLFFPPFYLCVRIFNFGCPVTDVQGVFLTLCPVVLG